MISRNEKNHMRFGLIFLLAFTSLAAYLNSIDALNKLGGYLFETYQTGQVAIIIYWSAFVLLFIPIYWMFYHSVRNWNWSLDEWGFGLHKKAWVGIGLTIISVIFVLFKLNDNTPDIKDHSLPIFMLSISAYARVAEELLYRGFALILLRKIFKKLQLGTVLAIMISSALFTLMHTHKPEQAWQQFLGGSLLIAIITVLTGSISLAVIFHSLAGGGLIGASIASLFFISMVLVNKKIKMSSQQFAALRPRTAWRVSGDVGVKKNE